MKSHELSLVPIDDLLKEIEDRCLNFIAAYCMHDPQEKATDYFYYGQGLRSKSIQLAADLQNDCLNNWNGELKTLQRINDEDD